MFFEISEELCLAVAGMITAKRRESLLIVRRRSAALPARHRGRGCSSPPRFRSPNGCEHLLERAFALVIGTGMKFDLVVANKDRKLIIAHAEGAVWRHYGARRVFVGVGPERLRGGDSGPDEGRCRTRLASRPRIG
jgi:hypothetical protein